MVCGRVVEGVGLIGGGVTKCEASDCDSDAAYQVSFLHADPDVRWSAPLCREHGREASEKAGDGEVVFGPVEWKEASHV